MKASLPLTLIGCLILLGCEKDPQPAAAPAATTPVAATPETPAAEIATPQAAPSRDKSTPSATVCYVNNADGSPSPIRSDPCALADKARSATVRIC